MHAVITQVTVHDVEAGRKMLEDEVIPRVKQAPGFVGGYWTRKDNRGMSMIVFESEDAAKTAAEQISSNAGSAEAVSLDSVEVREVVAQA